MFGLESMGLIGLFIGCFLAATVLPFSSDALYVGILYATGKPVACLVYGTLGNWLGGVTTYFLGRLAKWEWVERTFKIKDESLLKQKKAIDKWGVWPALLSWVPVVGDVISIAMGFYKCPAVPTIILLLVGKFARFAIWTMIIT